MTEHSSSRLPAVESWAIVKNMAFVPVWNIRTGGFVPVKVQAAVWPPQENQYERVHGLCSDYNQLIAGTKDFVVP